MFLLEVYQHFIVRIMQHQLALGTLVKTFVMLWCLTNCHIIIIIIIINFVWHSVDMIPRGF